MFSRFNIALVSVILGLCVWLWGQHHSILNLRAENLTQAQKLEEQEAVNANLSIQLELEIEAVRNQQKIANALKVQMETERENVKTILVKEPCGNVAMPNSVISSVKRLHSVGSNKN